VTIQAGDLVFCHSKGLVGKGIRLAEWLRFRKGDKWNHVAIIDRPVVDGRPDYDWYVIQAEAHGVTNTGKLSTIAPGGDYIVLPLPRAADAAKVIEFATAQVGRRYGFVTIVSILVTLLSPKFFNVMLPNTWICSAVAAESLRYAGWYHSWDDVYQVNPSEFWESVWTGAHA
jgi:hypothetical protein